MRHFLLAAVVLLFLSASAKAQCDPVLLNDSMQYVLDNVVHTTVTVGNTVYIGGDFSMIGQKTGHFICLDTTSGKTIQRGTWPRTDGTVCKAIADGAGGWIIGGQFSMVGDSVRNNIARIDANGHVTGFNPNANDGVMALLLNGTTLYVGGMFTNIGGVTRNRIAAINMSTSTATAWNPNVNDKVRDIYLYNTRLYVGGNFTTVGGNTRNYLAALNMTTGNADSWNANLTTYPGYFVSNITGATGKLYIGGRFDMVNGIFHQCASAIDTGTMMPDSWDPSVGDSVNRIIINGTTAYIAGGFHSLGSVTRHGIGEVSLTTGLATAFNPSTSYYTTVSDMVMVGNRLFVGGKFDYLGSGSKYNIGSIMIPSGVVTTWTGDADARVNTLGISNGKLFAGGEFSMMGSKHRSYAAAIDVLADTITAWDPNANGPVNAIAVGPSAIYIGGAFSSAGGLGNSGIASVDLLNGNATPGFNCSVTWGYIYQPPTINTILYLGGTLYFGGVFDYVNGSNRNNIAAVNGTSGFVTTWNPNPSYSYGYALGVTKLVEYGGTILLGGNFNSLVVGGATRSNFVALNAMTGNATPWNPSPDGAITTLKVKDNTLFVGGSFSYFGGVFAPRLARVNLTSLETNSWSPYPNGSVKTIVPFENIAFIAGDFSSINGVGRQYVATVDTISNSPGTWNPAPGYYYGGGTVNDIVIAGSKLFVSGSYYDISGQSNYHFFNGYRILAVADSISISGNSVVCAGTPVTYTASTNVIGGTYRWHVNGVPAGTGSSYTYTPANGDIVMCTGYIPTGSCYTTDSAQSNVITMAVTPYVTPIVSITGPSTVCAGVVVTDTVHTNVMGGTYQWLVNGVNAGTADTFIYTPTHGDHIICTFTAPVGCYSPAAVNSNTVTMTVNPNLDPLTGVTVAATTVCAGVPVTYHAHGINSLHYQWVVNGVNAGTDDSSYTYMPVNGDMVHCFATAPVGGCYITNPDSTGNIVMTVISDTIPVINISGNNSICVGSADTFHLTSNITGATYQWFVNGTGVATTTSYSYTPANGDNVKCILTVPVTGCYVPMTDTSNIIAITVHPNIAPLTTITADATTLCGGTNVHLNCLSTITGGSYQWTVNGFNFGAGLSTYTYMPANGDQILCYVTAPVGGCYTQNADTSNTLALTVTPSIMPTIVVNGPGTIVPGYTVTITATVSNAGSTYLITWYKNGVIFNTSSVPSTSYVKSTSAIDTITAKITSLSAGCYDTGYANTIYVYGSLGVNDLSHAGEISAYPNPFNTAITVKGMIENDKMIVSDMMGRKIYEAICKGNTEQQLQINDVASGTYLLHVTDRNGNPKANIKLQKL